MLKTNDIIEDNGKKIKILKHIGKGKGGNSYLAIYENKEVVFKKMHYEPSNIYSFESNKLQSELRDYNILQKIDLSLPKLLYYNDQEQFLVKEYVDGKTIAQIIADDQMKDDYIIQMFKVCEHLYARNLNIDYFPTNFVVENGKLFYIDYECNEYMEEWDFDNWGIYFWANTKGMQKFLITQDHNYINDKKGKPHKKGLEKRVNSFLNLKKK